MTGAMRLAGCLLVLAATAGCGRSQPATGQQDRGAALYARHCAVCHQADGRGTRDGRPSLAGSATANGDVQALVGWVLYGRRPATLRPSHSVVVMPQFYWLDDADAAEILTYIRHSFGNSQAPVSAAEVAAVRATARP